jgi:hypothetical protein
MYGFSQKENAGILFLNEHYTKNHQKGFVAAYHNCGIKETLLKPALQALPAEDHTVNFSTFAHLKQVYGLLFTVSGCQIKL